MTDVIDNYQLLFQEKKDIINTDRYLKAAWSNDFDPQELLFSKDALPPGTREASGHTEPSAPRDLSQEDLDAIISSPLGLRQLTRFKTAASSEKLNQNLLLVHDISALLNHRSTIQSYEWSSIKHDHPEELASLKKIKLAWSVSKKAKRRVRNIEFLESTRDALLEGGIRDFVRSFTASASDFEYYSRLKNFAEEPVRKSAVMKYRIIGKGGFGKVYACALKKIGRCFALKCLGHRAIRNQRALDSVLTEKSILEQLGEKRSPFCAYLMYAIQDSTHIYLAMPIAIGGDIQFHITKNHRLDKKRAKFYAAEVALGLAHMHSLDIVYRDLKPQNLLLDAEGHVKLTDFGLAKFLDESAEERPLIHGRCGTPGYWSPEVYNNEQYSFECDWWSFGVTLFTFYTGKNLFRRRRASFSCEATTSAKDGKRENRHGKIGKYAQSWKVHIPDSVDGRGKKAFPSHAAMIIRRLCADDISERLAGESGKHGFDEVALDSYFNHTKWAKQYRLSVEPPWTPKRGKVYAESQKAIHGDKDKEKGETTSVSFKSRAQSRRSQKMTSSGKHFIFMLPDSVAEGRKSVGKGSKLPVTKEDEELADSPKVGRRSVCERVAYTNVMEHKKDIVKLLDQIEEGLIDLESIVAKQREKEGGGEGDADARRNTQACGVS